jgi:hypothetical protein
MDIQKALELLRQYKKEIAHLKTLHHSNNQEELWKSKVNVVLDKAFGKNSEEYRWLNPTTSIWSETGNDQGDYILELDRYELGINKILQKYEVLGVPSSSPVREEGLPGAFIAHGGQMPALDKLKQFLSALGVTPIIAEEQPSENRSIDEQVSWCLGKCDCAVILATKGDIDGHTGEFLPKGNTLNEIGRCQERFPDRTIYLLEEGTRFPSNISEKIWEHFTQDNMGKAFIKIARELKAFGLIKAQHS